MIRRLLLRLRGCTCNPRFIEFAHDVDCPRHGLVAQLETEHSVTAAEWTRSLLDNIARHGL